MPVVAHILAYMLTIGAAAPMETPLNTPPEPRDTATVVGETQKSWFTRERLLHLLGGLQVGYVLGSSEVTAGVSTETGASEEIASGVASLNGFHISLYDGPQDSGFTVRPLLGFFQQTVGVTDFARSVPQSETVVGTDVEAICSFVSDGKSTPCGTPNTYDLSLTNVYGGLWAGYQIAYPWKQIRWLVSAGIALPLLEYRKVTISIGETGEGGASGFFLLRSWGLGASGGIHVPSLHASIRLHLYADRYGDFSLDQPAEFMGATVCDQDTARCTRERAQVDSFRALMTRVELSMAWVF